MTHSSVHVMCIVGARPNFMNAAPVIDALKDRKWATSTLVHTGQHYSCEMSDLFFDALGLPTPQLDLHVGSGPHAAERIVDVLERHFHAAMSVSERTDAATAVSAGSWAAHAKFP